MDRDDRQNGEIPFIDYQDEHPEEVDLRGAVGINEPPAPENARMPEDFGNSMKVAGFELDRYLLYRHREREDTRRTVVEVNDQNSIAKRMLRVREENKIDQMTRLRLVGCQGSLLTGLTNEFVNLMDLNLHGVQLTTLEGFPALPKLKRLVLSLNLLYDGFEHLLGCSLLTVLDISQNLIHGYDELLPLQKLINLQFLCVLPRRLRSPDEFHEGLPEVMFNRMPQLQYLDMRGRDGAVIEAEDIAKALGFQPI